MFEIPETNLPPGFVDTVDDPPARPATPRPAATVILLRDGAEGLEVLLMRRHRSSGFVPGAWVFPGGRVDSADSGPALYERIRGLPSDPVPDSAFWSAALRELFEETGVLLARGDDGGRPGPISVGGANAGRADAGRAGRWVPDAGSDRRVEALRRRLMDGTATLLDVLDELDAVLDAEGVVHIAHWVTPVVEPRRYDTHFFAAALPAGRSARPDPREMTEAAWLGPREALARFEQGTLPMVFPTVKTLQTLQPYESVEHALPALRNVPVPRILPRLVRTEGGVAIVVDEP